MTTQETIVTGLPEGEQKAESQESQPIGTQAEKPIAKQPEKPAINYEAEYKRLSAEDRRKENQIRSLQGNVLKQRELEATIRAVQEGLDEVRTMFRTQLKYQATGEPEKIPEEVEKIQADTRQRRQQEASKAQADRLLNRMHVKAKTLGVDITSDTRFSEAGALWAAGGVQEAYEAADELLDQIKDEKTETTISTRVDELFKEKMKEAGILTMDPGGNSGSAPPTASPDTIDKLWMDFDRQRPNEKNPYETQYRAILNR